MPNNPYIIDSRSQHLHPVGCLSEMVISSTCPLYCKHHNRKLIVSHFTSVGGKPLTFPWFYKIKVNPVPSMCFHSTSSALTESFNNSRLDCSLFTSVTPN